ncbi:hypothetical protein D3C78_1832970 [compost metagenome]
MQMTDEYMIDLIIAKTITIQLKLGTFAAVDHKIFLVVINNLRSWIAVMCRCGRATA